MMEVERQRRRVGELTLVEMKYLSVNGSTRKKRKIASTREWM